MDGRPNEALLVETERKLESTLGATGITEQPRCHGSSARYIHDPITQGYRPGGGRRSCGTMPRKSPRSSGPFLVVSRYTIWTHICNPPNRSGGLRAGLVQVSGMEGTCACVQLMVKNAGISSRQVSISWQ